jgi:hypothetical protein
MRLEGGACVRVRPCSISRRCTNVGPVGHDTDRHVFVGERAGIGRA